MTGDKSWLELQDSVCVVTGAASGLGFETALGLAARGATVMLADRVALLHNGKILDVGTHAELLARCPEYRNVIASLEEEKR